MRRFYTTCIIIIAFFIEITTYGQVYIGGSSGYTKKVDSKKSSSTTTNTNTANSSFSPTVINAPFTGDGQDPTNLFPPSPTAAGLTRYGDVPVSNHTGIPNINIPLYEVKTRDLSLPISLSYHASGIKVADVASWVGLGWSLNAGGVITRTVQSLPDEGAGNSGNGYLTNTSLYPFVLNCDTPPYRQLKVPRSWTYNYPVQSVCTSPQPQGKVCCNGVWTTPSPDASNSNTNYTNYAQGGFIDMEPDIFFFNVGGYSGKFIFDSLGVAHMFPEQDTKIELTPITDKKFEQFILTVPNGTKYYFGGTHGDPSFPQGSAAYEMTSTQPTNPVGTSWFLTKIVSANAKSSIFLTYSSEQYGYYDLKQEYLSFQNYSVGGAPPPPEFQVEKYKISGVRLDKIFTSERNSQVDFKANTVREDLSHINESDLNLSGGENMPDARRLDEIIISASGSGTEFKKIVFNYDYFISTGTSIFIVGENPNNYTKDKKRLKLLSVREQSFDGSIILPAHQFEYNSSITIPRRISFGRDHWGYFNGKENYNRSLIHVENGDGMSKGAPAPSPPPNNWTPFLPSNRSTDAYYLTFASLNKIIYPTGGYTTFDFEANNKDANPNPIGGLRIKTIKNFESNGVLSTQKNFDYLSSGKLFSKPTYFFTAKVRPSVYYALGFPALGIGADVKDIVSSNPVLPLSTTQGNHIGYGSVKVSESGNGSTTYMYNLDFSPYPVPNSEYDPNKYDYFGVERLFNYPFDPEKENYKRGQLVREVVKKETGEIVNETVYNYTVDERQVFIPAVKIDANTVNGLTTIKLYNRYAFFTGRSDLTSKTTTTCDFLGANCITRTSSYNYDSPYHFQMTNSTEESSNGELVVSKLKYAQDYVYSGSPIGEGGATILTLKSKNIVTSIESNVIRKAPNGTNERVVSGGITFYDNTVVKPTYKYSLETTDAILSENFTFSRVNGILFEKDSRYPANPTQLSTYYTNSGNIKESLIREGTNQVTTYLWGYNHAFPIAQVQNANYATVEATLGATVINNLATTNNQTDVQIRTALEPLLSLPNTLTTIYTYNPLLGVTSVTPPDRLISYYEYDKLGRLQFIKNNKGEIVKGYKYGYK